MNEVEILPPLKKHPRNKTGTIDWETIERDWRGGIKSVSLIGEEHNLSHTAIIKHFKKLGVPRDLSAKIAAKTEALVSASLVSANATSETKPTETDIINTNAAMQATIILARRKDIQRYVSLAQRMLEELEGVTDLRADFAQLGELLYAPNEKGVDKLNEVYLKVMALPGRVDSLKKLSEVLKTLIGLERQAFGLSDNSNGEADKPPAESNLLVDNNAARRIAYVLLKAERGTQ